MAYRGPDNKPTSVTATGTVQGGTLTDGTASITSGAASGLTAVTASGDITTSGGSLKGDTIEDSSGAGAAISIDSNQIVTTTKASYAGSARLKEINNADYTVTDTDGFDTIYASTTLTADRTITLPTAADNAGRTLSIKKVDSSAFDVIVDGEGSETIDGVTTVSLYVAGDYVTVMCDGSNWVILNRYQTVHVEASTSTTAGTTSTPFAWSTETQDTASAYNNSTGVFTAPVAGTYVLHAQVYCNANFNLYYYKNSTQSYANGNQGSTIQAGTFDAIVRLAANDTVEFRPDSSQTATTPQAFNHMSITLVS